MSTFLLNLELISDTMRQRKIAGVVPMAEELKFQGYDPSFQNTCPYFANAICHFLISTIFGEDNKDMDEAKLVVYRNIPVASMAARKLMQWYRDPYTRVSIPTIETWVPEGSRTRTDSDSDFSRRGPRDYHFHTALDNLMIHLPNDPLDETAIVPGLNLPDVVHILTAEPTWQFLIQREKGAASLLLGSLLENTPTVKPKAWKSLSLEARAVAVHQIVGLFSDMPEIPQMLGTVLLYVVSGLDRYHGTADEVMWLKLAKLAMTKKSPTGIGFPFGPHTEFFAQWYERVEEAAAALFQVLADVLIEQCNGFSLDLLPPTPVLNHIAEYAMEPFSESSSTNMFLN